VQVQVVENEEIPELEAELQKLDELPPDESLMTAEMPEALPDTPPDEFVNESLDLAGLSVSAVQSPAGMENRLSRPCSGRLNGWLRSRSRAGNGATFRNTIRRGMTASGLPRWATISVRRG
jgi:hypothetical protein